MSNQRRTVSILCHVLVCLTIFAPTTSIHAHTALRQDRTSARSAALGYPPDPPSDIEWSANRGGWSDVVAAFNHGRQRENALLGSALAALVFPPAASWEAMSDGEKAIWLINEERIARGLAPLHGLEQNVNAVAQGYAEWLLANNQFAHDADGRSPWERLDANATIGACHDFLAIAENLYFIATTGPDPLPIVIEQAVYRMLYEDAGSNWGHRHAILWTPYTENSGAPDREGFVGVGHAQGGFTNPYDGGYYQNTDIIVMNFFDPCATWVETTPATPQPTTSPTSTASPTLSPTPTTSPTSAPVETPTPPQNRSAAGRVITSADSASLAQRGNGLADVTITVEDGQTTQTNANGDFMLDGLSPAKYRLTPSKEGYSFSPPSIEVDLTAGNRDDIRFTGISGPVGSDLSFSLHLPLITPKH